MQGLCVKCGYDLRGNPAAVMCPECGEPISAGTTAKGLAQRDTQL